MPRNPDDPSLPGWLLYRFFHGPRNQLRRRNHDFWLYLLLRHVRGGPFTSLRYVGESLIPANRPVFARDERTGNLAVRAAAARPGLRRFYQCRRGPGLLRCGHGALQSRPARDFLRRRPARPHSHSLHGTQERRRRARRCPRLMQPGAARRGDRPVRAARAPDRRRGL